MEAQIEAACAAREIPNAVLLATDKSGKFKYSKAFGKMSLEEGSSGSATTIQVDSPMWIASCTKLITTISAMQCVERGLLELDADVTSHLHELKDPDILTGFDDDGKPQYVKAKNKITLRQLLTHSAGMAYDLFNPTTQKWRKSQGQEISPGTTIKERYLTPLLYEPGRGWEYSPSIDWAGKLVERATNMPLQQFMEENIWKPLGIKDMTFFIHQRDDLKRRMPAMSFRTTPDAEKAVWQKPIEQEPVEDAMGGGQVTAAPTEYIKILHAILKNDGLLLKPETVEDMFKPHLSEESREGLMKTMSFPEINLMMGGVSEGTERNWGLGGLLIMEDSPEKTGFRGLKKGTMSWGGMPNLTWWIDLKSGICGLYASQILPPGDKKSVEMSALFEKAMYERYMTEIAKL